MKRLALLLILVTPTVCFGAGDYTIEELIDENATTSPPFSISRVVPFDSGLRLFFTTDNPDAVADLFVADALQAELSDLESETATPVSLALGELVWCSEDGDPVYLGYLDPLPVCGDASPAKIEYFFELAVTLGPGIDLAIGQDPDFLWLIEEQ